MDEAALAGLASLDGNPQNQERAAQYFEQLKASQEGWRLCAAALSAGTYQGNDHVKFFCLQVVEHHLKSRYFSAGQDEQQDMKSFLLRVAQMQGLSGDNEKTFIRNKVAQVFSLACVADYPNRWPSFFDDELQLFQLGEKAIDLYLKIMLAIDSEVVDREIAHTADEIERNTMIKDTMRVQCVPKLVDSWYHILITYENSNPELTCLCLDVIGNYISWIDIALIANNKFVTVLLRFLANSLLRESTCDCIHEIITKGMEPVAKAKLIESFMEVLNQAGILNVSEEDDSDFLAKLSKLINGVGLQLILGWQKLYKAKDVAGTALILNSLEMKVPLMFHFLGNDDDDVSGAISQYAHDYITLLKQTGPMTQTQQTNVKDLLCVVIKKMKYDDSYNFQNEGEDEAMFQEYRKQLKVIINNIGVLDSDLLLGVVRNLFTRTIQQWQSASYQDVEVAITMLYILAEALPTNHGQHFLGDANKVSTLQELMRLLVTSQVNRYQHSSVAMQFFETVVRYDKFFNQEPQFIPEILIALLDERGLRNPSAHVRSRTSYLFSRFVKSVTKAHLQDYIEDIMQRIQDLLVLNTPDNNGIKCYLSSVDQLFIYETASVLVVHSQFSPEKKQFLMKQLLVPVVSKFESLLHGLSSSTDEKQQQAYVTCLTQAMAFASRSSKGFTSQQTMKQCGCVEAYTEALQIFLLALAAPLHRGPLHAGVRQYLHRMVVCLDTEVLPFIPIAVESLLQHADAREMHDFIPLLNQVISKFKKQMVPFLQEGFMPVVTTIFQVLNTPVDERDQVAATEKKMLQRGYFSFLATIVNNNVTEVLSGQDPEHLRQVLLTLIQGAVEIPDPIAQKSCFSTLRHLIEIWGGKDGLVGFDEFMYNDIVPACLHAPMKPTFDLADAQTVLALNECSQCLKTMVDKQGDKLCEFLQSRYLPTLNMAPSIIQEFMQALKSDPKVFRNYYKSFFIRWKS